MPVDMEKRRERFRDDQIMAMNMASAV